MAHIGLMTALTLAGTAVSAVGTIAAGQERNRAAQYEAAQMDIKAGEERAAAQREALALQRQKRLALSALQARSAASGFSASDPSTLDLAGEIDAYGTYQAGITQYGGESRSNAMKASAAGRRAEGKAAATGAIWDAFGTALQGGATAYQKFGGGSVAGNYG